MEYSNGIYYSATDFYKKIFGQKVYKIALDAGCTCPNRDGTKGWGRCIFCSQSGSGDFAGSRKLSISAQVQDAKELVSSKIKTKEASYIAYFQNFTSTYGDEDILFQKYREALSCEGVKGLAVATRPDCLSDSMIKKLAQLSESNFVSIELGLQTSNDKTAEIINRKYKTEEYSDCVKRIKTICPEIHVVTHIIFGLPGENEKEMLDSVRYAVSRETDGIKITVLHVLKNTVLEKQYSDGKVCCLEKNEYFELIGKALKIIPAEIVIHRLTGDGAKKILIAPLWTANKKDVLNSMKDYFLQNGIVQGIRSNPELIQTS